MDITTGFSEFSGFWQTLCLYLVFVINISGFQASSIFRRDTDILCRLMLRFAQIPYRNIDIPRPYKGKYQMENQYLVLANFERLTLHNIHDIHD